MSKQNGGPAFPVPGTTQDHEIGMTLRDWLAGQAIAGLASDHEIGIEDGARMAWKYADAMLRTRTQEAKR